MMSDAPSLEGVSQRKTLKPQEFFGCPEDVPDEKCLNRL